jgi:hypothetical protein
MMSFRTASRAAVSAAVFCAVALFVSFRGQPAFAENVLPDRCLRFACQENYKKCNSGGHLSAVTVDANTAIEGCPAGVTVWYDGDKSSKTPFQYFSCGCRHPDVSKITK